MVSNHLAASLLVLQFGQSALVVYRAGEDADDTQVVEKGLWLMAHEMEYMTLQLDRTNDRGDVVDLINEKQIAPIGARRPVINVLAELSKEGWEVVTSYTSSNGKPNLLLRRLHEKHEA